MKDKHKATCLACNYKGFVYYFGGAKYQEVSVCPKCNGAFVDDFTLGKYLPLKKQIEIAMTNPQKPPIVKLNGEPIRGIVHLCYEYRTSDDKDRGEHFYEVEYFDDEIETVRTISVNKL